MIRTTLTRRPLKCDGPPPAWVMSALDHAKQAKVLTLALPVELAPTPRTSDADAKRPLNAGKSPKNTDTTRATQPSPSSSRLRLLLGRKKRGFGEGYFNGFGGKLEPGESTADAAVRELREESGLRARDMAHVGVLTFVFDSEPERPWQVHVYAIFSWGEEPPVETEEMAPRWFGAAELPFSRMWADDRFWYPRFVEAAEARLLAREREDQKEQGGERPSGPEQEKEEEEGERAADPAGGAQPARVGSAPCFEGVFGFRSTHEMAWAGLWALEGGGGGGAGGAAGTKGAQRSAVADEAAAAADDDAGSGARDAPAGAAAGGGVGGGAACPWLPRAPSAAGLAPESLAHLVRAAELAKLTAGVPPTSWKGWVGGRGEPAAAAPAAATAAAATAAAAAAATAAV